MPRLACGLAVVLWLGLLFWQVPDLPWEDDYDAVLGCTIQLVGMDSLGERAALLFAQHNEHRFAGMRAAPLFSLALFGRVRFDFLCLLGNLGLVGSLALICLVTPLRGWALAPVWVLGLSLLNFRNLGWSMSSLSNHWILFTVMGALVLMARPGVWRMAGGLACLAAALAFQAGGWALAPAAGAMLAWQRRWSALAGLLAAAGLLAGLYFWGWQHPAHHPAMSEGLYRPWDLALYFLYFLGNFWGQFGPTSLSSSLLAGAGGLVACALVLWLGLKGWWRRNPALSGFLLFMIFLAGLIALGRLGLGKDQALVYRYTIFSLVFWGVLFLGLAETLLPAARRRLTVTALAFCLVFTLVTVPIYGQRLADRWSRRPGDTAHWLSRPDSHYGRILSESIRLGVYDPRPVLAGHGKTLP
jgi:hypothetical protein